MKKSHIVVILLSQLILGAMVLTTLGVGKISSDVVPVKNTVGMVTSYDPDDEEKENATPQLNKTIPLEKKKNGVSKSTTSSTHATTTTSPPRPLKEESFECPKGIPAGAKRVNTSYANGYREFYVLPTGAYVGPYVEWYDSYKEQKRSLTCFGLYGKEDGPGMEWSSDGILVAEKNYVAGLLNGIYRTYYPSGALNEVYTYLNGKRSSIAKTFYEYGGLKSNATYIDGKKYGAENEYYPSGSLMQEKYYDGDEWTGISVSYHQSGDKNIEWRGKEEADKFSGLYAEWDRGVACIYKEGKIMDCRYMKIESYKTGEIILESLNVMPGSERMNGVPQFFNVE